MGSLSIWHWLIVLLVVVLVFGTKKLKNIGHDLGGAVKGFKEGIRDANEVSSASDEQQAVQQKVADASKEAVEQEKTIDVDAKAKS